jgi:hypothetical protein
MGDEPMLEHGGHDSEAIYKIQEYGSTLNNRCVRRCAQVGYLSIIHWTVFLYITSIEVWRTGSSSTSLTAGMGTGSRPLEMSSHTTLRPILVPPSCTHKNSDSQWEREERGHYPLPSTHFHQNQSSQWTPQAKPLHQHPSSIPSIQHVDIASKILTYNNSIRKGKMGHVPAAVLVACLALARVPLEPLQVCEGQAPVRRAAAAVRLELARVAREALPTNNRTTRQTVRKGYTCKSAFRALSCACAQRDVSIQSLQGFYEKLLFLYS